MQKINICLVAMSLLLSVIWVSEVNALNVPSPITVQASNDPEVSLDNKTVGSDVDWIISGGSSIAIKDDVADNDIVPVKVLEITHSSENENSFMVDSSGDINFADGSVFVDRSVNKMGIGTMIPEGDLHIAGDGDVIFDDSGSKWQTGADTEIITAGTPSLPVFLKFNRFQIKDVDSGKIPFRINKGAPDNSLTISSEGKLSAVNTLTTNWKGTGESGLAELFKMSANNDDAGKLSDAGFVMENARAGFSWAFRTLENTGGFAASKQNTGAKEFELRNPTNVASNIELHLANGAFVDSNGQWHNASSRSYKENINPLSSQDAMQALRALNSVTYQFKRDTSEKQLVGFIAEDVPALLATRDKKTVDPLQIVAVLTKVVQEQDKSLKAKEQKIAAMEAKIAKLEILQERLARVEALLPRLTADRLNGNQKVSFLSSGVTR